MKIKILGLCFLFISSIIIAGCGMKNEEKSNQKKSSSLQISEAEEEPERKSVTTIAFLKDEDSNRKDVFLSFRLSCDWCVLDEGQSDETKVLLDIHNIYDKDKKLIGRIGYQYFDEKKDFSKSKPEEIYQFLLKDKSRVIAFRDSYKVLNTTYDGKTATVDLYYQKDEESGEKRYLGILAYNTSVSSYVLMEFDADLVTSEFVEDVAKSIHFK